MVAFDGLRRTLDTAGLDHVRVERSLHEPRNLVTLGIVRDVSRRFLRAQDFRGFIVEDRDELAADDLALRLGVGNAAQLREKALRCIHRDHVELELVAHVLLHLRELVLAQHAVVHENAREPVADGPLHQYRRNGRVDAAAQTADGMTLTDLLADAFDSSVNERLRSPIGLRVTDAEDEIAQQLGPLL